MPGERADNRAVFVIIGADREKFLHGLVTHDVGPPGTGLTYAALLTPQGKFLADFFLLNRGEDILLDTAAGLAPALFQRLSMYKLRADVAITQSDIPVARGLGTVPPEAWSDPRHPTMGWRAYGVVAAEPTIDWDAIRVAACIPESGVELIPGETFILEAGFDALGGVDHRKGCYVGQEVTARMKHKTELKKGLRQVEIDGAAPVGTPITAQGKPAGTLFTQSGDHAIAYLRFDRAKEDLTAGAARLRLRSDSPRS